MAVQVAVTRVHTFTAENMSDIFSGAFEGGSNYWLTDAFLEFADNKPDKSKRLVWYGHENLFEGNFTFRAGFMDPENEEEKVEKLVSYPRDVERALDLMAVHNPRHLADLIDGDNADAETYDVFMQFVILGEVIFG